MTNKVTNKVTIVLKYATIILSNGDTHSMNFGRENEQLEFKKSTSEIKEAMDDICAILNKHGSGAFILELNQMATFVDRKLATLHLMMSLEHAKKLFLQ